MTYHEYQKAVFDWLMAKHQKDPGFTFSVRQKASKGSESNYFIGTETSNYFGFTLWTIPVGYPGSATDLINVMFTEVEGKYAFHVQFQQTKSPHNDQNKSALKLIQEIKPKMLGAYGDHSENAAKAKMERYSVLYNDSESDTVEELLKKLDKELPKIISIVDSEIEKATKRNKNFIAHRITKDEFRRMMEKLEKRVKKYQSHIKGVPPPPEETPEHNPKVYTSKKIQNPNIILYGPPGTGKTYHTINKALELIEPDFYNNNKNNRFELTKKFKELKFDPTTKEGQIGFVTFHQSLGYEDFIEGIKPVMEKSDEDDISYDVVPGIFKSICDRAFSKESNLEKKIEWLKKECSELDNKKPVLIKAKNTKFTVSYRGGITFRVRPASTSKENADYPVSIENIRKMYQGNSRKSIYNPTYTIGILRYLFENGLTKYEQITTENKKNYVLIIDEINRGNIASIFGELITLLEHDKRLG